MFGWKNSVSRRVKKNDCEVYWGKMSDYFFSHNNEMEFSAKHYVVTTLPFLVKRVLRFAV